MAQTRKKTASKPPPSKKTTAARGKSTAAGEKTPRRREIGAVVCLLLSVFTFIGYFSGGGVFIGFFRDLLRGLVGVGFFAFPPILLLCAVTLTFHRGRPVAFRVTCTVLLTAILAALLHLFSHETPEAFSFRIPQLWADGQTALSGGVVGGTLAELSSFLFSRAGAAAVFICLGIFLLLAAFNKTLAGIFDAVKSREKREYIPAPEPPERPAPPIPQKRTRRVIDIPLDEPEPPPASARADALDEATPRVKTPEQALAELEPQSSDEPVYNPEEYGDVPLDIAFMEKKGKTAKKRAASEPAPEFDPPKPEKPTPDAPPPADDYSFPPITLLASGASSRVDGSEEVRINSERLEASFRSFGVTVKISNTTRGPSVTRYEAELEAGVKLSRLTSLADDIALSLGTSSVRISAMQDKISTVGIEVPNKLISRINLREIIDSPEFRSAPSRLTFAIGKNISGESI
ncbi:MAG: DNA translocase FtsK 4TM domain-containing protein, partial [Oscillospiraceae bacterium]|nr:DNA translocase FtsK 4TM domain-containing protein [Oscillospiraceae bacterium]